MTFKENKNTCSIKTKIRGLGEYKDKGSRKMKFRRYEEKLWKEGKGRYSN
jgi:hypothetical protein